jgi:SecD/SecF fusion protein
MAANEALKNRNYYSRVKPVVKDSLSALLADGKDSATTKRKQPLLDKIIAQGGGPVLGLFSKDTATVNGYFKRQDVKIY